MIGGQAPSRYLNRLQELKTVQLDDAAMDAIVARHFIDPRALRADNFDAFYAARNASLIALVERAMAKPVAGIAAMGTSAANEDGSEEEEAA